MGGLAGAGTKRTLKALEAADKEIRDIVENGGVGGHAGAAQVVGTAAEEGAGAVPKLGLSPLTRLLSSASANARNVINRLARHNFFVGKNKKEVMQPDGTTKTEYSESSIPVEVDIARSHQKMAAYYLRQANAAYKEYRRTGGTLRRNQFMDEVGRTMRRGDKHESHVIEKLAGDIRTNVIDPVTKGFQELGDLPENLQSKFSESYLPRVYDIKKIKRDMDRWLEMLTVHFTGNKTPINEARQLAQDVTDSILGSRAGRLPDVVGTSGRLKERTLNIRDEVLEDFLVSNVDEVLQTYLRSTVPELHLKREFGDHELIGPIQNVRDEYAILIDAAKNNKERVRLQKRLAKDITDIEAIRDIMLGRFLPPADHAKKLANFGRLARAASFMANLGMMTISAIPDIARPIMQHGAGAWAKALPRSMLYWGKKTKLARRDLEDMGIGVDSLLSSRVYAMADVDDVGSGIDKGTKIFAKLSMMNLWNSTMKKVAGFTAQNRFIGDSINYASLSKKRKERLAKAGINETYANRIAEQYKAHGEVLGTSKHANTNQWADRDAAGLFERVLLRDVDNTIITPSVADKPLFMSTELGKTLMQFRSFFLAAHNQAFLPMLQQMGRKDVAAIEGLAVVWGLGQMSAWVRLNLSDRGDELQNYSMQDWVRAGLDRSGAATIPMELFNMADRLSYGKISQSVGMSEGSRYFYRSWLSTMGGPAVGYVTDTADMVQNLIKADGITERDIHSIRRLAPFQNMFYMRKGITEMEKAIAKGLNAKPRKRKRKKAVKF